MATTLSRTVETRHGDVVRFWPKRAEYDADPDKWPLALDAMANVLLGGGVAYEYDPATGARKLMPNDIGKYECYVVYAGHRWVFHLEVR